MKVKNQQLELAIEQQTGSKLGNEYVKVVYCHPSYLTYMLSTSGEGNGTPLLLPGKSYGWRSLVGCSPWVAKSRTRLSDFTFTFHFHALEKEMATHSSVLAWRIPGMGEPGGLPSIGRTESDTTEAT